MANIYLHARVTLQKVTLVPADACVMTFAIGADDATVDYAGISDALDNFFNVATGAMAHPLCWYMSNTLDRSVAANSIDIYDVSAHLDGSPIAADPVSSIAWQLLPSSGANDLPQEVAACLTLFGAGRSSAPVSIGATRPKQRHTGRVYFGPLNQSCLATIGSETRVHALLTGDLGAGAAALCDSLNAVDAGLCVWSRADAEFYLTTEGYVDNAFDTIRSRGPEPTSRDLWAQ